jgi:hypothetical protein
MPDRLLRVLLLCAAAASAPASGQGVRDALEAVDLICEFHHGYRRSLIADLVGAPRRTDLIILYEAVSADSAQAISGAAPGRKPVRVRATANAVHLIQRVGPSVRTTTLTGCERTRWKNGYETCVRFAARHAWHFDSQAHFDPDGSFERLPSGASAGACEPWRID